MDKLICVKYFTPQTFGSEGAVTTRAGHILNPQVALHVRHELTPLQEYGAATATALGWHRNVMHVH